MTTRATPSACTLLTLDLSNEQDVVQARQRTRLIAQVLGFDEQDQTRLATAASELARNAVQYAFGGGVRFALEPLPSEEAAFVVRVTDRGPGILNLPQILDGRYVSTTGMGLGILGARRLSDRFTIESSAERGTAVEIGRVLPRSAGGSIHRDATRVADALAQTRATTAYDEVQRQNREMVQLLDEMRARQAEVERLNAELQETNRGVLALYAELDDRAVDLRRASEGKSRFLSHVSHELRTPLTSVQNLTRILLDRADGELTSEQETQVNLIRNATVAVIDLVNDLLDLARIESGTTALYHAPFQLGDALAALRGMCRPLVTTDEIALIFESAAEIGMYTDERRLSQVLRNFVSNAIKYTERGEVRVAACPVNDDSVRFDVVDTGIGIAPGDLERIFEEFTRLEGERQRRVHGTGIGLALSRNLAHLLGGRIEVTSVVGEGSTFTLIVPRVHPDVRSADADDPVPALESATESAWATGSMPASSSLPGGR